MNNTVGSSSQRRSLWQIFRTPFWVGVLSAVGLVSALLGDGWMDAVSWIGLAIPVVLCARYTWGRTDS
ncbi:hypothetical protein [Ketobacter sp.]|uniref:hypothetical protein n=1 Tax=Ketobacter sp. TaxID=2083498 RepID=UPI000F22DF28|nr:hypothetical protein [Ketobacter sp.]RLU00153.1 MAG: hypothetical protein D9N14_06580 [Ketobacter sp.]